MNYVYDYYYEPFEEADMPEDNYPSKPKWMVWVAWISMSIILGAILFVLTINTNYLNSKIS